MEQHLIDRLKCACNAFYMNIGESDMTDKEFDALRVQFESESGSSVKTLVDWDSEVQMLNEPMNGLSKIIAEDNELINSLNWFMSTMPEKTLFVCNYKYDGSSIKAYYVNGKLQKVLGTPDVEFGFVRTKAFWNLFPHEVPSYIKSVQGEVLVDADVYGELARNKANGLTNSKWKDDEVDSEAFIRAYKLEYWDGDWSLKRQVNDFATVIPTITRDRARNRRIMDGIIYAVDTDEVFKPAENLDKVPTEAIVHTDSVAFQVDGIVVYTDQFNQVETQDGTKSNPIIQGVKFYYTEYKDAVVTGVQWNAKPNGSYAAVLNIEPVTLNQKYISNISAGGVPNLMANKMGKGAVVRVILANMTIPKVIKVITPSEDYQWPTCSCGYEMSDKDIYGSTLKCQNVDTPCNHKVRHMKLGILESKVGEILSSDPDRYPAKDFFRKNLNWVMSWIQIDRWDPAKKLKVTDQSDIDNLADNLWQSILDRDIDGIKCVFEHHYWFTALNWSNLLINLPAWVEAINQIYWDWWEINKEYVEKLY